MDISSSLRAAQDTILVSGIDDWINASWLAGIVQIEFAVSDPVVLREFSIVVVDRLLSDELFVAGELLEGFQPWTVTPQQAVDRIRNEWTTDWSDEVPPPGAIFWAEITEKGKRIAHLLMGEV